MASDLVGVIDTGHKAMPGVTLRRPDIPVGPGAWDWAYLWALALAMPGPGIGVIFFRLILLLLP